MTCGRDSLNTCVRLFLFSRDCPAFTLVPAVARGPFKPRRHTLRQANTHSSFPRSPSHTHIHTHTRTHTTTSQTIWLAQPSGRSPPEALLGYGVNNAVDGGGAGEGTGLRAGIRAPRARAATAVPAPLVASLRERSLRQLLWIEDEAPPQRLIALQAAARTRSPLDPASLPADLVRVLCVARKSLVPRARPAPRANLGSLPSHPHPPTHARVSLRRLLSARSAALSTRCRARCSCTTRAPRSVAARAVLETPVCGASRT